MKNSVRFLALVTVTVTAACGGRSEEPYALGSIDETCETDGNTGAHALAAIVPEYSTTLVYFSGQAAGTRTPLTVRIRQASGPVMCVPGHTAVSTEPSTPAHVEVPVDVAIVSQDGKFNENFTTRLSRSVNDPATMVHTMSYDRIQGTYRPDSIMETANVAFNGTFGPGAASGGITTNGAIVADWTFTAP